MQTRDTTIRISSTWSRSVAYGRIYRKLGNEGIVAALGVWSLAATEFQDGVIINVTPDIIAGYSGPGVSGDTIRALMSPDLGVLKDLGDDCFKVLGWDTILPEHERSEFRKKRAEKAGKTRWGKKGDGK